MAQANRKPNMKELTERLSGMPLEQMYATMSREEVNKYNQMAAELLYGVVGSNKDTRDWNAIMSSPDVVNAAQRATGEMYSSSAATQGKTPLVANPSGKPSIVEYTDPETQKLSYVIAAADGTPLRSFNTREQAERQGASFGIGVQQPKAATPAATTGTQAATQQPAAASTQRPYGPPGTVTTSPEQNMFYYDKAGNSTLVKERDGVPIGPVPAGFTRANLTTEYQVLTPDNKLVPFLSLDDAYAFMRGQDVPTARGVFDANPILENLPGIFSEYDGSRLMEPEGTIGGFKIRAHQLSNPATAGAVGAGTGAAARPATGTQQPAGTGAAAGATGATGAATRPTEPYWMYGPQEQPRVTPSVVQQPVVTPTGPNAPARQPAQFTPNLSEYYKTFGGQQPQPSLPTMQPNYSVPTVTGGLSSMPSQFTTRSSYTGTPTNVSPELYQQPESQQGVRLVMYRNPQGAMMYITEANGVPMTAVPAGYSKVQAQAQGGMTKQQSSGPFTPQQKYSLLQRMGYRGPASDAQMQQFIEANPATAARFGKLSRAAMKRTGMAQGGVVKGYQEGGLSDWEEYKSFKGTPDDMFGVTKFAGRTFTDPATGTTYTSDGTKWTVKNPEQDILPADYPQPTQSFTQQLEPRLAAVQMTGSQQPTMAPVSTIRPEAAQFIPSDAGATMPFAPFAEAATMQEAQQAGMPIMTPASVMQSVGITPAVTQAMEGLTPAVGQVSRESQVEAAQLGESSVSQLQAAQGQAYMMNNPVQREIQAGELISGAADAAKAAKFVEQIQAAEATPTKQATVQGQLETLMQQFEGGATPAWAAGAMRNAMATLSARGLGASSLAGQAVIQAAMESALPIAQIDAQTRASFESQNLSNRQQVAMFAAQQRAAFMQMEFDQAFQSRVQNAARIADVANMNFTAEQQVALENSRAANTMNLANLGNRQAMIMAEAAALSNIDMANLNNRQQAAVQNAQNFLQMDMTNLGNEQQTALFRAQQTAQALFTDQAAENAARQFNATSDNQTQQFFASLGSQVSQFNAAQRNAIDQYNIDQVNSVRRFNSEIQQQRDLFNAQNGLVIAQANAQWRQNLTTLNTASQNEANRQFAQVLNNMSQTTLDQIWQRERDIMSYSFNQAESALNRASEVLLAQMEIEGKAALEAGKAEGSFMSKLFETAVSALAKKIAE